MNQKPTSLTTFSGFMKKLENSNGLCLITSVTRDCVLQCKYCYAIDPEHLPPRRVLSLSLLEKIIHDAFEVRHENIDFEWTGGEALLAGQSFYEKVLKYQKKYEKNGKKYHNTIQTSGGVYNELYYDFLIDNGFTLSLTIDGPRDLHESQRPTKGGSSSFDNVIKSYEYIKKKQGKCGVLCTLTKNSLGREKEVMEFYREKGIMRWHSNPYYYDPSKPIQTENIAVTPKEYAHYFKTQFDQWLELDDTDLGPSQVESLMGKLSGLKTPTKCTHGGRCLTNFINIDPEGNAAICPKFLGYAEMRLGNIQTATINELLSSDNPVMKRFLEQRLESMHGCEKDGCKYIPVCNSGCPYDSFLNGSDNSIAHRDALCPGKHEIYEHIDQRLQTYGIPTITSVTREKDTIEGGSDEC